jgi:hypothetical protein
MHDATAKLEGRGIAKGSWIVYWLCPPFTMFMCSFHPQPYNVPLYPTAKLNSVPAAIFSHFSGISTVPLSKCYG